MSEERSVSEGLTGLGSEFRSVFKRFSRFFSSFTRLWAPIRRTSPMLDSNASQSALLRVRERFHLPVGAVGLDAGYYTPAVCKGLMDRERYAVMGYCRPNRSGYREYVSNPAQCERCACRQQCTRSRNHLKIITRHV